MEKRKTNKSDLEGRRTVLLLTGLIVAISLALLAFEWKTPYSGNITLPSLAGPEPETGIIDIYIERKPELPKPVNPTTFTEVDNNREEIPDITITTEIDPFEGIEVYKLPGQVPEEPVSGEPEIFLIAEKMPEFPGGEAALHEYLKNSIRYPEIAKETGISGVVYIFFVVEPDGNISNIRALRGIPGGCTEEAMRVVNEMPDWLPGKQLGKAVRVNMTLPVKFVLR